MVCQTCNGGSYNEQGAGIKLLPTLELGEKGNVSMTTMHRSLILEVLYPRLV